MGAAPGVGKRSAGRPPTWDCPDAPRLDTALHTSRGGEGLWTCGSPLVPLSSLSLFFGGRNLRISMRRPQGEGLLGPYTSPCHISVPVGIKKEQNLKTGNTWVLFSGGWRSTDVFIPWEFAECIQQEICTLATLHSALCMQVSSGPSSRPLSTDLLSGQKEAATETLRQMERCRIWKGAVTGREDSKE